MTSGRNRLAGLALVLSFFTAGCGGPEPRTHVVEPGDFALWTQVPGTLEAETSRALASTISQPTAILYLAPEGTRVAAGEVVAELDRSPLDQQLAALDKDAALAGADLQVLAEADLPLELADLERAIAEADYEAARQARVVERTGELHAQDLVSASELEAQEVRRDRLEAAARGLRTRKEKLETVVHPARLAQARAKLDAARRQRDLVRDQADRTTLTAPIDGMVAYLPMHIDGEYRTVREGDTVVRNQKLALVADMSRLVAVCEAPEAEAGAIAPGAEAVVTATALPGETFRGRVVSVGELAVSVPGRPPWPKVVTVRIALDDTDPRLKTGATVVAQVLSVHEPDALILPRALVRWDDGSPWCEVIRNGTRERVDLVLGPANDREVLVRDGVSPGDVVAVPDAP